MDIRFRIAGLLVGAAIFTAGGSWTAAAHPTDTTSSSDVGYHAETTEGFAVLGPRTYPNLVVASPPLGADSYLVRASVGVVVAPHDRVVCGSSTHRGGDGAYSAVTNQRDDTVRQTLHWSDTAEADDGQTIGVTCFSSFFGRGTYVDAASVTATPGHGHGGHSVPLDQ